ncbi:MAG: SDR family oxidoreductase [Clostridia bacterium]
MGSFNPLDLSDRTVLITGASSGIGRASAIYLSKLGARIIASGRDESRLHETLEMLEGNGHAAVIFDLSDTENVEELISQAVMKCGKLNGLVHCAGIPYVMPLNVLTPRHMEEVMRVNFLSFVELMRVYAKPKYSASGSIVAISSILATSPRANETGYIASKGAINAVVGSLACDLAKKKIRVNGIICGNIMTEMVKRTVEEHHNEEHLQKVIDCSLLGLGQPEDIASVVAFLISDMSRFITGRNLYADGGLL